jgi:hypothetical protein
LFNKTAEAVVIAFEFEAMQDTVHKGEINPCSATSDTQFVNDRSVWISTVSAIQVGPQGIPDIGIMHGGCWNR